MKKNSLLILTLLLPVQFFALKILHDHPEFVEQYYSNGVYPFFSMLTRSVLGVLPFSFGDLLYTFMGVGAIVWLVKRFKERFRNPKIWLLQISAAVSVIYACFHILWGFNYYREPLHKALEIENDYNTPELIALTKHLIEKSNEVHLEIAQNDSVKVDFSFSKKELFDQTIIGYESLAKDFPKLEYEGHSIKPSLYSIPLTYMGFNGYLNPFTNEAQVNTILPDFKLPTTASHEVAHQLGFAAENEANFIACLATMNHPNAHFRLSGYTFALNHCLNELFKRDNSMAIILSNQINYGIKLNFMEMREFWVDYKNPFEPIFMYTYNSYLEANKQVGGMKSYSYVVALLVNYFNTEKNILI